MFFIITIECFILLSYCVTIGTSFRLEVCKMALKISDRIKLLREENGLSQEKFAHALCVSRMTINNYETGKRSLKYPETYLGSL